MSEEPKIQQLYPSNADDLESEKEILEAILKLTPTDIQFKCLAINHNLLKLKNLESNEQAEIAAKDAETARNFQVNCPTINAIINGTHKLSEDELKNLDKYLTPEELAKKDELLAGLKPIPEFWVKAMKNHSVLKQAINEEDDEVALKHLTSIEYKLSDDPKTPLNFTVNFHFSENPFFTNELLSVTLHLKEPREATKIEGTEIKYKEGKNLTKKIVEKKQRNKKTGQTRSVKKEEDRESFFLLFKTIEHDHAADNKKDDEEDEEHDKIHEEMYDHVEWAYTFYEELIPYGLEYYLGLRKDEGAEGEDDDFEDDEGDDDEDEDEDEKKKPSKKSAKPVPAASAKGGDDKKQECKQQ